MAECLEVLCEDSLEEQKEEITVLQSIFEDDLQILQGSDGRSNACFSLKVKAHIPHDVINLEAFIPVEVLEELPSSHLDDDPARESLAEEFKASKDSDCGPLRDNSFDENHLVGEEMGFNRCSPVEQNQTNTPPDTSPDSFLGHPRRPGFTRTVSLQHWHVNADIQYLTPIHLTCSLPPLYPTECPPNFSLACLWLTKSQLQEVHEKLMQVWTENPNLPVIFTWADWLQNNVYEYLHLGAHLVLKEPESELPQTDEATNSAIFNAKLETALLTIFECDLDMQRQAFRQTMHLCEICFDERDGTEFHYLDECKHFFCTDCLKAHCESHVDSGTVLNLQCPSHECQTMLPPEILQEILDTDKLQRWERLLLTKTLDIMGDIVYCPRCNMAVVADEDEGSRLGHCANCFHAFCTECYEPWHHGQPCFSGDSDSDEENCKKTGKPLKSKKTRDIEEKGGKAAAVSLRAQEKRRKARDHKMNMSNLSFIRMMKQQGRYQYCPKCRMAVERITGCDMMHCSQCGASFCWQCGMYN